MPKNDLQEALDYIPLGKFNFNTTIPPLEETLLPVDVDEAVLVQGILAHNINCILKQFEGFPPLVMLARLGQHNEALQLMAAASVQYLWADRDFQIVEPKENIPYAPGENTVSVQIIKGTASNVSCTYYIDGTSGGVINMVEDEDDESLYIGDITFVAGEYEFIFVVTFGADLRAKRINITVTQDI